MPGVSSNICEIQYEKMWLRIVCLAFGALLLDPVVSEDITCETIEISKGTHNFTATIHSSSFEGQNNDQFYSCVWLRSQTSDFAPELQWTGRFRLVFAGYRAECASVSVRISYMENGAFQSTDVRPTTTGIGNGRMSHKFSKKISLDSNSRVSILLRACTVYLSLFAQETEIIIDVELSFPLSVGTYRRITDSKIAVLE